AGHDSSNRPRSVHGLGAVRRRSVRRRRAAVRGTSALTKTDPLLLTRTDPPGREHGGRRVTARDERRGRVARWQAAAGASPVREEARDAGAVTRRDARTSPGNHG